MELKIINLQTKEFKIIEAGHYTMADLAKTFECYEYSSRFQVKIIRGV